MGGRGPRHPFHVASRHAPAPNRSRDHGRSVGAGVRRRQGGLDLLAHGGPFLGGGNDLLGPLIYLDSNEKFTVAIGVANLVTSGDPSLNLLMAANLIMMLPAVLLYFFAQDKLIGGIASVGLKG